MPNPQEQKQETERISIESIVNQYKITVSDVSFWTPYWIGQKWYLPYSLKLTTPESQHNHIREIFEENPHLFGKNSPQTVQKVTEKIFDIHPDPINTSEEARYILIRNGLGVDCSGFVYWILNNYLESIGKESVDHYLVVSKSELQKHPPRQQVSESIKKEIEDLPDQVTLKDGKRLFNRDPWHISNVKLLTSPENTEAVNNFDDAMPGDLIWSKSSSSDHVGIVTEKTENEVVYTESYYNPTGPGGVVFNSVPVTAENKERVFKIPGGGGRLEYELHGIRRPKFLK